MTRRFTLSSRATSTGSISASADPPKPNPDKYADELLDAYLFIENADALYAEYLGGGESSSRESLATRPGICANLS